MRIEKDIEVDAPLHSVYNQWTQFEDFPVFMDGVREVRQLDDTHLHWCASVGGKDVEWDSEIVEQVPDQRIAWRSTNGKLNAGTVEFEPIGAMKTRVCLTLEYDPEGAIENVGSALGVTGHRVRKDLEKFKAFIEQRGAETGAWRGEVEEGERVR
jgi:uncharacterized membrane protein